MVQAYHQPRGCAVPHIAAHFPGQGEQHPAARRAQRCQVSQDWSIISILSSDWLTGAATLLLISVSAWTRGRHLASHAKWMGFVAVIFFCLAAVIFPIGFSQNEIGGAAYQLPNSYQVLQTFPSSNPISLITLI